MDFNAFLSEICSSPIYRNQIVYHKVVEARDAVFADTKEPLAESCLKYLAASGIEQLYSHQAEAIDAIRGGKDMLIITGTASGKSLCYQLPLLEMLEQEPDSRALLLHPAKALSQDQFQSFRRALIASEMAESLIGVFDGDTPSPMRRKLRDEASLIYTNPDMLHAALLPQHPKWASFLSKLKYVIVDELHTYSGLFGSNAANLFRRFERVCNHYGSHPQYIFCSATIGNPAEVAEQLTGREVTVIDNDGSPRGKRTFIFWNPPRITARPYRSRRSANVEAHELMVDLLKSNIPTIIFSKAIVTAELLYRYVTESLEKTAPHLAKKITPYRGGYIPQERREIERKLFAGELIGVSTTRALELGIDIGGLDASIIVGYPGTLAGFFQQAGRAGRRDRESLAIMVAVDTPANQYVMNHPEYIFGRPIESMVFEPNNPYILAGQLRCAVYELPLVETELSLFGDLAQLVLEVLVEQHKLNKVGDRWYHASDDVPQHDVSLRGSDRFNVTITDVDTNKVIGELSRYDVQPIIHPEAIYMHQGETYLVLELDLERNQCFVKKVDTDYYTQPIGGQDVHHIDQALRERDFGNAKLYFGEVTVFSRIVMYEKIHFYSLDAISRHGLNLPHNQLDTMAFWLIPSEELVREVLAEDYNVQRGLMGIAYAIRMMLPLFVQCETLDFSHSTATAVNAPWHTMFVFERYPHGLGFTEKAFEILADILPEVYNRILTCDCEDGCPCCVGKPLRGYTTWNIERGEATIPSKSAALRILKGILGDGTNLRNPDADSLGQEKEEKRLLMERGIRRLLEQMAVPEHKHPIDHDPQVGFPDIDKSAITTNADIARRAFKLVNLQRKQQSEAVEDSDLDHERIKPATSGESKALRNLMRKGAPTPKKLEPQEESKPAPQPPVPPTQPNAVPEVISLGDSIAARARKLKKKDKQ